MLNKNHLGKAPNKAEECRKMKGPYNINGYQVNICVTRFSNLSLIVSEIEYGFSFVDESEKE